MLIPPRIASVRELIERQYAYPLSSGRLARHAGLRVHALVQQFRTLYGQTPEQYLLECRMRAADALLARHTEPAAVALQTGHRSLRHYERERRRYESTR